MSTAITLHVFSGRPNPVWTLSDGDAAELQDRLSALTNMSSLKAATSLGGLGYRGFSIGRPESPFATHVHAGIVDPGDLAPSFLADDRALEVWLLGTAGSTLPPEVHEIVAKELAAPVMHEAILLKGHRGHCPPCHAADAPIYTPALWNTPSIQPFNNCYNYANNHITNTFAQPGRATGHLYTALQCAQVQAAAQSDGLHPSPNFTAPLGGGKGWYVAMVIWPGVDYHWYRQDKVGCWSHKPGGTAARNIDNSGHAITDPKTCDRGPYTNFCTYMVTHKGVHIK